LELGVLVQHIEPLCPVLLRQGNTGSFQDFRSKFARGISGERRENFGPTPSIKSQKRMVADRATLNQTTL
jgi:hypothetical protein